MSAVEHDIRSGDPEGRVDDYRFTTLYPDPRPNRHDEHFGRVVDPI